MFCSYCWGPLIDTEKDAIVFGKKIRMWYCLPCDTHVIFYTPGEFELDKDDIEYEGEK